MRIAMRVGLLVTLWLLAGCPADDDDTTGAGDDDTTDPGDDDTTGGGDDDSGDDDDSAGDDDDYDCWASPLETAQAADGSALFRGSIDEHEIWFVLDTAAQVVFADLEISDDFTGYFTAAVQVGPFDLPEWQCKGRDLATNQAFIGVDVGALYGQDLMMQSYTVFDPSTIATHICPTRPPDSPPGLGQAAGSLTYELQNQFPVAQIDLGLAGPVPLMVDSGQALTYLTESAFAQVDDGAPRIDGWVFATNYGADDAFVSRVPQLSLGGLIVEDVVVVVLPDDYHLASLLSASGVEVQGFVGNNVLGRFAVGIDGATSTVDLWPVNAPWTQVNRWQRVGIEVTWREGAYTVEYLLTPSDAADQGVGVGDLLLAVDDVDVNTLGDLGAIQAALRGTPGDSRRLTLQGAEGPYQVDVQIQDLLPSSGRGPGGGVRPPRSGPPGRSPPPQGRSRSPCAPSSSRPGRGPPGWPCRSRGAG